MTTNSKIAPFLRAELFRGLTPLQLTELARNAERMIFCDGDVITRAGEFGYGAYLIHSGKLLCDFGDGDGGKKGSPEPLDAGPGAIIDEMAMLIEGHRSAATVYADGQLRAFRLARAAIHEQMAADPDLADHFVGKIARRLDRMAGELRRVNGTIKGSRTPEAAGSAPGQSG